MLPPKHCNINLTGPIPRWDEAIPLGNGILGSLFWGPMEHLRISVDIAGLWLRRRPEEKLDKEFTYAKLVELARKGDVAETRRIFDTPYARPTPTKIPAGHLFLDGLPQGSYQASLDLGTAVASFSQSGRTILRACLCMGRPVGVLMLPETYRDVTLTVERPSFGNGTQAAEAGNSVSPGSLQQLALPDAIPETEDGMIGFSQKVDDRTAYTLLCKKCGATLYYTAVQAENVEKASRLAKLELCAAEDPSEVDTSIRTGWFYHPEEDTDVRTADELLDIYLDAVGANASLLLNIPPDTHGRIAAPDCASLAELGAKIRQIFASNVTEKAAITADSAIAQHPITQAVDGMADTYWQAAYGQESDTITLKFPKPQKVSCVVLGEHLPTGQRIERGEIWADESKVAEFTVVGHKRICRFAPVDVLTLTIKITASRTEPTLRLLAVYQ